MSTDFEVITFFLIIVVIDLLFRQNSICFLSSEKTGLR